MKSHLESSNYNLEHYRVYVLGDALCFSFWLGFCLISRHNKDNIVRTGVLCKKRKGTSYFKEYSVNINNDNKDISKTI